MARAALPPKKRIGQGPRAFASLVPAATVAFASLLNALPIVSVAGWYPDLGFMVLLAWRLLRSDPWPSWWAAPMGLLNDLLAGFPLGLSMFLWCSAMLLLDLLHRRTMWRDYWVEWGLAALLLAAASSVKWEVASVAGAGVPISAIVPNLLIAIVLFPIVAWLVSRVDRWRLGR